MIKLNETGGNYRYVNEQYIVSFYELDPTGTLLVMIDGEEIKVDDTADAIMALIHHKTITKIVGTP